MRWKSCSSTLTCRFPPAGACDCVDGVGFGGRLNACVCACACVGGVGFGGRLNGCVCCGGVGSDTTSAPWYTVGGPNGWWPGASVGVHGRGCGGWAAGSWWPYCAIRDCAAALGAWRLLRVPVPEMPAAAYRASMPPPGIVPGSTMGVSGGGGDPRLARVVELEAVEEKRLMGAARFAAPPGGG
jgi:hypothetical protein